MGVFAVIAVPLSTYLAAGQVKSFKTRPQKPPEQSVRTNFNQPRPPKKDYCGYPEEPIQAGMSEYCAFMYNIYCRRGVGCNQYGRDFGG